MVSVTSYETKNGKTSKVEPKTPAQETVAVKSAEKSEKETKLED